VKATGSNKTQGRGTPAWLQWLEMNDATAMTWNIGYKIIQHPNVKIEYQPTPADLLLPMGMAQHNLPRAAKERTINT
jgi:hypothetical protein